jgi:hypothetical protein
LLHKPRVRERKEGNLQLVRSSSLPSSILKSRLNIQFQIVCESKRIHIDLCKNDRGEFFKLSEIDNTGKRNKIFFPVSGARVMADTFDEFAECDEGYGDSVPSPVLDAEGYPQV